MVPHLYALGRRDKKEKLYRLGKLGGSVKVYGLSKDYCLRDISGYAASQTGRIAAMPANIDVLSSTQSEVRGHSLAID